MRARSMVWVPFVVLGACSNPAPPPVTAGETCQVIEGPEPRTPDSCHFIATLNPLTGPLGAVGLPLQNAAQLAVRDINAEVGTVDGKPLCLVACDTRTDPSTVEAIVDDLVAQYRIRALNGAAASSSSVEAAKAARVHGIAQVSCCSTSPVLSSSVATGDAPAYEHVFRTVPSDALQGLVLANVARGPEINAQDVAVIHVDDAYGRELQKVFSRAFVGLGGRVVQTVAYTGASPGSTPPGYADVVASAFTAPVDHAVLIAFPSDGAQIMRDWRLSGLARDVRWLATDGLRDRKFVLGAGMGTTEGVVGTAPLLRGVHFASFDQRYRDAFAGEAPGIFTSNQYDAVMLIALGMATTGAGDDLRVKIREAASGGTVVSLEDIPGMFAAAAAGDVDYSGASGEVDIDLAGDVLSDYEVWRVDNDAITRGRACWSCVREPSDLCNEMACPADQ